VDNQPALRQGVEIPISGTVKLLDAYLAQIGQCAQFGVLFQLKFLYVAFTIAARENSIYSHSGPPYSKLLVLIVIGQYISPILLQLLFLTAVVLV
jgi:hypothetical protein